MKKLNYFFISIFIGLLMIWGVFTAFTVTPAQAQENLCTQRLSHLFFAECRSDGVVEEPNKFISWMNVLDTHKQQSPAQLLDDAYQRVIDAKAYEYSLEGEQTLIPRALVTMIGQSEQRVDVHVEGEVTLPDYSMMSISMDGLGLDPTPVAMVIEDGKSYLLREGEKIPTENPIGVTSPNGDYLSYLAAAKNVQHCESDSAPFETAVSCYTYNIDGPAFAEHVRLQLQANLAQTPGATALGAQVGTAPLLQQMSGEGKVWLDANGLPLRQKVDLHVPEVDTHYDADISMYIDYRFEAEAIAAATAPLSILPAPEVVVEAVETSIPHLFVLILFLTIGFILIFLRRRRWMYSFVALSVTFILVMTPVLQIINLDLFFMRRAHAAEATEPLTELLVADAGVDVMERPLTNAAAQSLTQQIQPTFTMAYNPDSYCGRGGNGDRDGDGLADDAEYCLGTNPNEKDTDFDGIDDGKEVNGFTFDNKDWYSDPLKPDSNLDGINDDVEWSKDAGGAAASWDIDGDKIPNVWDIDDDGDGVSDGIDLSPASVTKYFLASDTAAQSITDTFKFNISGSYNGYIYIDMHVQPEELTHLNYGATYMDWRYDNKGLIQDLDGSQDDIRLFPYLSVETDVAPAADLAKDYNVVVMKDTDGDGVREMMMPLSPVGSGGNSEAFSLHMAYGPDSLANLNQKGINWENAHIVWIVQAKIDSNNGNGVTGKNEAIHMYTESSMRLTGWNVTKSGQFSSAVIGTPDMHDDDRQLFNLLFGLSGSYLKHSNVTMSEIVDRFSGANTPVAEKWGITTTVKIETPPSSYAHFEAGTKATNDNVKSFLAENYPMNETTVVILASESNMGIYGQDDLEKLNPPVNALGVNLSKVFLVKQRSLELHMRDGWDIVSGTAFDTAVLTRVKNSVTTAKTDLVDQYPSITTEQLSALTLGFYITWQNGRNSILNIDGVALDKIASTDEDLYKRYYQTPLTKYNDPANINTLPGYLVEVGNFGKKGSGLIIDGGPAQIQQYLQANLKETRDMGFTTALSSFVKDIELTLTTLLVQSESDSKTAFEKFNESDWHNKSKSIVFNAIGTIDMAYDVYKGVQADKLNKVSKLTSLKKTASKLSDLSKVGVVLLVIDIGLQIGMFFAAGDYSPQAIASLLAGILVSIMLFVISLNPIAGIIVGIVAIVDLILMLVGLGDYQVSGYVTKFTALAFYSSAALSMLDSNSITFGDRKTGLMDDSLGYVQGNRFRISSEFKAVIELAESDWSDDFGLTRLKQEVAEWGGISTKYLYKSWACAEFKVIGWSSMHYQASPCPNSQWDYDHDNPPTMQSVGYKNPMLAEVLLNKPGANLPLSITTKVTALTYNLNGGIVNLFKEGTMMSYDPFTLELPDDMDDDDKAAWSPQIIHLDILPQDVAQFWTWSNWGDKQYGRFLTNPDPDGDGMSTKDELNARLGSKAYSLLRDDLGPTAGQFGFANLDQLLAAWETEINGSTVESQVAASNNCPSETGWPNLCDTSTTAFWLDSDSDDDGLTDKFEYDNKSLLGTDLTKYDTDGDGLSDGFERQIGTAINVKDSDGDGLTDAQEVYHPTKDGSWAGGYEIELPKYGAVGPNGRFTITVQVFSNPRLKDTDGDGFSDLAEKENGTSATAYNRVPQVTLVGKPWTISPTGKGAVYVGPSDRITLTSKIDVFPPFTVSDTLTLDIPSTVLNPNQTPKLNGSRSVPNTGVTYQPRWDFSNNVLQPWEYLYATTTGWSPSVSNSRYATATLTLPYNGGKTTQIAELPIILDADNPTFQLLKPAHGDLLGGGMTHYVMGGSSDDTTTWVDQINLDLPYLSTQKITDSHKLSPWAYTWELPSDGIYNISGRSIDFVDNYSLVDDARIMIDNTAPTTDVDLQDNDVIGPPQDSSVITITLNGTASENYSGLTRVQISTDYGPWREVWTKESATQDNTTYTDFSAPFYERATGATWTAEWTLPNIETVQGYHSLRVRAFDEAGNWPTPIERTIIIDVMPPTDDLVNRAYLNEFPHVPANEPHTFRGVANDVGNVPQPSRPEELVGTLDSINDATIWLGMNSISENGSGVNVAWIGDFNGDRRGDLLVGLPAAADGAGKVAVVYGRSGNWPIPDAQEMLAETDTSFKGMAGAGIGMQATSAGDVNGDGLADILIGDAVNNVVYLILGENNHYGQNILLDGPSGVNIRQLQAADGEQIGHNFAAAGDVNGDGYDDILIGVTGSRDIAYLLLGQSSPIWETDHINQHAAAVIVGAGSAELGAGGDLNGDFRDEFAIGMDNTLYLFAGSGTYSPRAGRYLYPNSDHVDTFTSADSTPTIAALGDVDGDNKDDAIYSDGNSQHLILGDDTLSDGDWTTHSYSYGSGFLAAPGDVDKDGRNDILIGNGTDAYLILGSDTGTAQATINGVADAASVHYAAGSDLNSDGSSDLLLVPTAASAQAAATTSASTFDLPPSWVPNLPEQSLETFMGDTTWASESVQAYVSSDGVCHGLTPCYATIQDAVNSHNNSATILVQPGVYAPFIIDGDVRSYNGLTVRGMDTDAVIIDGNGGTYGIRVDNATSVNLEHMTVRNASYGVQLDRAGINGHENTSNRTDLRYMLIYDTGSHDIYMSRDSSASVINSTLTRSSNHVGTYGDPDANVVVEWEDMQNTTWAITDGGGAVLVDDVIYVNRGGGHTQFDRYSVDGDYWFVPWGPSSDYEADSVIAAGSDDQVYLLGAPHLKDAEHTHGWRAQFAAAPDGNTYLIESVAGPVQRWNGNGWDAVPGSPAQCRLIATHPENSDLYCLDYGGDSLEKWDGSSWTIVTDEALPSSSLDLRDMVVDANGVVHVVGDMTFPTMGDSCYHHAKLYHGSTWGCEGGFEADDVVNTIDLVGTTPIVGGEFSNEYYDNIKSSMMPGVAGLVYDIEVGDDGAIYVGGEFTSTLDYSGNIDKATPAGLAVWKDSAWTAYEAITPEPGPSTGYWTNHVSTYSIAETASGELYVTGNWISFPDGGGDEVRENFVHWTGSSWERIGLAKNGSNNAATETVIFSPSGVFMSGDFEWLQLPDLSSFTTDDIALIEFSHEVYSTTQNAWTSGLLGAPMSLGDGASYVGDEDGNLVLLVGGDRTDSFKYEIETNTWSRVGDMPHAVNASAMTLGENGDIYAITNGSGSFYKFSGSSWSAVGPTLTGSTIDDGVTMAYDSHTGTYYVLPGGNGTKMYRYNPNSDSSWTELAADRETPSGINPGAGLIFVKGEDENYLYTAQGNNIGSSTAFWRYPLPMPNKIDFTDSIIYAQNATSWLNLSDPLPEDFNFRVDVDSRFFGGTGWTPTNMGTLTTTTETPFLDASRDLYRMGEDGSDYTIGYHSYTAPVTATTDTGIQAKINSGANQVIVEPGYYEEDIYLVNGVEVIGTNPDWTIIKPLSGSSADALVRAMGSNGASFSRFTLDGEDSGLDGFAATGNAANLTLQRARIYDTETAISLDGSDSDVEVVHVTAVNNTNGLTATNCASIDVRNTIFAYHTGVGLSHQSCADVKLHTYNLYWANANDFGADADAGAAELFLDPSFVDPSDHDYRTLNFSPVIDAGNPTDPSPPGAGSRADIGYVEQGRVNFYVDDSYCSICTNDGLTWKVDAFDTIQDALNAAENALANLNPSIADVPQLIVGVAAGTYNEQITMPSHVLLLGSGAEETIIDADGSGTAVTFNSVTDAGIRNLAVTNADTAVSLTGASNTIDLRRNLFTNNTLGVFANGRATVSAEYNTFVNNASGLVASDSGSWIFMMHNIISGSTIGVQVASGGQIFTNYNLYFNAADFNGLTAGENDITGQDPLFAGGEAPYRLSETSPAIDAASLTVLVPNGGGSVADLGYSELLAAPITLLLGQEDLSTVMGNSGVATVEYGVVAAPDVTSAITSTLPTEWHTITLDTPGDTLSYWAMDHTPLDEGLYRFYSRATDDVGNQEDDQEDWYDGSFVVDSTPPTIEWLTPSNGASLEAPLELRAQVSDYAAGAFSIDENDVYFEVGGQRYPATWAAEPWNESTEEPRVFRAWISPTLASYSDVIAGAEDKVGNSAETSTTSFTVTAVSLEDTTPPTVTVSLPLPNGWMTHTVQFTGTATDDGSGVASVEVSVDGGSTWQPATVSGDDWTLTWEGPLDQLLVSYPAKVRVFDRAGNSADTSLQFTVDEVAPSGLLPITFSAEEASHFDAATTLNMTWTTALDASGVVTTLLTVDQISATIPTDVVVGNTANVNLDSSGDWYAHLAAVDAAGNAVLHHFGPWHVGINDGAFGQRQQSIIIDGYLDIDNNEWRLDSEYLDDDERTFNSEVTYSPSGKQSFLTTWDANHYYMAWRGSHWILDGDLWIYMKAGGSGSNELIEPLASAPSATLPFDANYAIQITDPLSGTLYEYNSGWQVSAQDWAFAHGGEGDTEIRLPMFGTSNVETLAFGLGDDKNVWAIFPTTNPLNPAGGVASDSQMFGMNSALVTQDDPVNGWVGYEWVDVTAVTNVADNQPKAVGLSLDLDSPQSTQAAWGSGSTLQYVVEIENVETDVISGQPIVFTATQASLLVHDSIQGASCSVTNPWECTLDPLSPGTTIITLTTHLASDVSGAESVLMQAALNGDNLLPELTIEGVLSHRIDGAAPEVELSTSPFVALGSHTFSGSASDGDGVGVDYVEVRPEFGNWQRVEGTEFWTVDLTVAPFAQHGDTWQFEVRAADHHGQISTPKLVTFTVDLEAPEVAFNSPTELSGSLNEIEGIISDLPDSSKASEVFVQLDDEPWREAQLFALNETTGEQPFLWSWNMPTEDGVTHTLRVQTKDLVGNEGSLSPAQDVWVDNVPPVITVTNVFTEVAIQHYVPGAQVGAPVLSGAVTDGTDVASVQVWIQKPNGTNSLESATLSNGIWTFTPGFQSLGVYLLQVRSWDTLNNQSQTEFYEIEVMAAPDSGPNQFTTQEDLPISFQPLLDDSDEDSPTISLASVESPDHGTAVITSSTWMVYTPTQNFNGVDIFTYVASDGQFTDTATITVTVLPVNDPPEITGSNPRVASTDEDNSIQFGFNAINVDENDTFSWSIVQGEGTAVVSQTTGTGNTGATVVFTPDADFNGSDSFTVKVSDGVYTDDVTVNVNVNPQDDAPRSVDDYYVIVEGEVGNPITLDVMANDDEVDNQTLLLDSVGLPSNGGAAEISSDSIVYTPTLSLGESETIGYVVSDGVLTDTAVIHTSVVAGDMSARSGETMVVPTVGISDTINLTMTIPSNVGSGDEQVTVVLQETAVNDQPPQGFKFVGLSFELNAYVDGVLTSPYTLTNPITLEIVYSDEDVAEIGKGDDELALFYWNGSEWIDDGITIIERDQANNRLVVKIEHFTQFALFGKDMVQVYLPMIVKP